MKTIKLNADTISNAALEAKTTPEGFVSLVRSISAGRKIKARCVANDGQTMTFELAKA